jgi:hypothetical protein
MFLENAMSKIGEILGKAIEEFRESSIGDILGKIYDGAERPVIQGAAEIGQAIFTGNAYVPYGRGTHAPKDHDNPTPEVSHPEITPNAPDKQPEQEVEM